MATLYGTAKVVRVDPIRGMRFVSDAEVGDEVGIVLLATKRQRAMIVGPDGVGVCAFGHLDLSPSRIAAIRADVETRDSFPTR